MSKTAVAYNGLVNRLLAACLLAALTLPFIAGPAAAVEGQTVWSKKFTVRDESDNTAFRTAVDGNGNVYVAGVTEKTSDYGRQNSFIRKYNPAGKLLWTRRFGGTNHNSIFGLAVDRRNGAVYAVGMTSGAFPNQRAIGYQDAFIRKYNSAGTLRWTRQFGAFEAIAFSVAVGPSGAVYVGGMVSGALPNKSFKGGWSDGFVRKYSSRGGIHWTRQIGTRATDLVTGVAVNKFGQVYVVGSTGGVLPHRVKKGGTDAFIRKYTPRGGVYWTRQFGRASDDLATGVVVAPSRDVYVVGTFGPRGSIRKFSPSGKTRWTRLLEKQILFGAAVDAKSRLYAAGFLKKDYDTIKAVVHKYRADGGKIWTRDMGEGVAFGPSVDPAGDLYVSGTKPRFLWYGSGHCENTKAFLTKIDQ